MKILTLKKNLNTIAAAAILGIFFIVSFLYLAGTIKENASRNFSKNKTLKAISAYYKKDAFPPSQPMLEYYEDRKGKILEYYNSFRSLFISPKEITGAMPDILKFKEELVDVQSQIKKRAESERLIIKEAALALGFDKYEKEIPSTKDIPDLMLELYAVKELASLMIDSRVAVLEKMEILEPQDKALSAEKNSFVRIYPVHLTIESDFGNFVKFLDYCGKSSFVFVLNDLHVYSGDAEKKTLKAEMSFDVVTFL